MVLPTLPPYAVDYPNTATYYWPNIVENLTQISDPLHAGLDTWEAEPASGPFGFNAALKLDGTQVGGYTLHRLDQILSYYLSVCYRWKV